MPFSRHAGAAMLITGLIVLMLAGFSASAGSSPGIAIHGDSTAIASRIPLHEKPLGLFPSLDGARWWNRLRASYAPRRLVFNDARKGSGITAMRQRLEADLRHRNWTTIIYDRSNGEPPDLYLAELRRAVGLLETERFLILPQVPSRGDAPAYLKDMAAINAAIRTEWPKNTFDQATEARFIGALSDPATREADAVHRNPLGWSIEARFIGGWLTARGW